MNLNNQPPDMNAKINLATLPTVSCEACKSIYFRLTYILKRVSPLLSGRPKEYFIPIELFVCENCGAIVKQLNPMTEDEVSENNDIPKSDLIK